MQYYNHIRTPEEENMVNLSTIRGIASTSLEDTYYWFLHFSNLHYIELGDSVFPGNTFEKYHCTYHVSLLS